MPQQKRTSRKARRSSSRGAHPEPGFERPAPPEATNYEHPEPIGIRAAVPGAGVVASDADAGPIQGKQNRRDAENYPGHGPGPLSAPNAVRPGTTRSRPAAVPSSSPDSAGPPGGHPTEAVTAGGDAPLSVPSETVGPQPAAPDVPELYDPNYTAASEKGQGNPKQQRRARTTRKRK